MAFLLQLINPSICFLVVLATTVRSLMAECDPKIDTKKAIPSDNQAYFFCNHDGRFLKRNCPEDKRFNSTLLECVKENQLENDIDPFLLPQYQAPDDLCNGGVPLTRLSAPVVCNPSISSCPDGYVCTKYEKASTAYCCQRVSEQIEDESYCADNQVTYLEASTGKPRICSLSSDTLPCPLGFTCTLIQRHGRATSSVSRCCGKSFGCPQNSVAQIDPNTESFVSCSLSSTKSCHNGFTCTQSSLFDTPICCSDTKSSLRSFCPAGTPLNDAPMQCSTNSSSSCPEGYFCVKARNDNYCCPSHEKVCTMERDGGNCWNTLGSTVKMRYYFDSATGTCRSFKYSGCGGNDNNFDTLAQCHAFCLAQQCDVGVAYRTNGLNAACSPFMPTTCPNQFTCREPLFGPVSVCCPTSEKACNEMPTSGTSCFGRSMTIPRYFFDQKTQKCKTFDYFGCSGNNNNFRTKMECEHYCLSATDTACDGAAPLKDPNGQLQNCTSSLRCPSGYYCNPKKYCCPNPEFACAIPMSSGKSCAGSRQQTSWYYNGINGKCMQFTYLGCDGTANRFASQQSCMSYCGNARKLGNCPMGMSPYLTNGMMSRQTCKLNVAGSCPKWFSCVPSTTNVPICCETTAMCPEQRIPYVIPGSDSIVSCQPDKDSCPALSECVESSVAGFYMCCSQSSSNLIEARLNPSIECPRNLPTNGQLCQINAPDGCPSGYICLNRNPSPDGICCKSQPMCLKGSTYFVSGQQAQICGRELDACPKGTACLISSVPSVSICCKFASVPAAASKFSRPNVITPLCSNDRIPFYDPGSRTPRQCLTSRRGQCPSKFSCQLAKSGGLYYCCPVSPYECDNGRKAYQPPGSLIPQSCSLNFNSCPPGYSCRPSADGSSTYCCLDLAAAAECPQGSSPYLYANRPLACPSGSTRCPNGYSCTRSTVYSVHLCCSASFSPMLTCTGGIAYIDPVSSVPQSCTPLLNNCPSGYFCQESSTPGYFLCCTSGHLNTRYSGYCPINQIPYVRYANEEPQSCHMTLRPCPITAQYTCIYSAEKLNSYCCAPIDTTFGGQLETHPYELMKQGEDVSGCPSGSRPLINQLNRIQGCNPETCPPMYSCHYSGQYFRYQCCSSMPSGFGMISTMADTMELVECEPGSAKVKNRCMKLFYLGQKGCEENEQCSLRLAEARCERNYCVCPRNKLIHQSKCVTHCPEGFIDIAARCRDLTTIVFMDSVDERINGTIGGYCKSTVVTEEQCDVKNSYCNEITVTCQCKPGYELKLDFSTQNDTGSCIKMEDSRYAKQTSVHSYHSIPIDDLQENYWTANDTYLSLEEAPHKDNSDDMERYLFQLDEHSSSP